MEAALREMYRACKPSAGHGLTFIPLDGLIGDTGRAGASAAASGENEGSVRREGGPLCVTVLPRRRELQKQNSKSFERR